MTEWALKRFWKTATTARVETGFGILLDSHPVRTPAKKILSVPTEALAERIAAEFDAQDGKIDPKTMPFTRTANSAIDKVAVQHAEVADMLADYGDSDLLCYRADAPEEIVARQSEHWDPLLEWAAAALDAPLKTRVGVIHESQDPAALSRLRNRVHQMTAFELAAFHDLVAISGSLIIGFATQMRVRPSEDLWTISRLDEIWQEEQWGVDEEAQETADLKKAAFLHADRFLRLIVPQSV